MRLFSGFWRDWLQKGVEWAVIDIQIYKLGLCNPFAIVCKNYYFIFKL